MFFFGISGPKRFQWQGPIQCRADVLRVSLDESNGSGISVIFSKFLTIEINIYLDLTTEIPVYPHGAVFSGQDGEDYCTMEKAAPVDTTEQSAPIQTALVETATAEQVAPVHTETIEQPLPVQTPLWTLPQLSLQKLWRKVKRGLLKK